MTKTKENNKYWQMEYVNELQKIFAREMKAADTRKKKNSKEKPQSK